MSNPVKISIVTPVRNGERFIRATVDSVLSQRGDFDLEYIVRDGQSTDATLSILEHFRGDPRLTVVSQRDGSPQEAINAGMAQASGDLAAWLNADDLYAPGALAAVAAAFRAHPRHDWLYGRCRIIDADGGEIRKPITLYKSLLGYRFSRHLLLCENYINQPATFWRLALWRDVGRLDSRFKAAWDYQLWLEMAARSPALSLHRHLADFRRHDDSISENHFERQFQEELAIATARGNVLHRAIHRLAIGLRLVLYRRLNRRRPASSGRE